MWTGLKYGHVYRHAHRNVYRHAYRPVYRNVYRHVYRHVYRNVHRHVYRYANTNAVSLQNAGYNDTAVWWARRILVEGNMPRSKACKNLISFKTIVVGHPIWVDDVTSIINYVLTAVFFFEACPLPPTVSLPLLPLCASPMPTGPSD